MPQWGNTDDAANSVIWAAAQFNKIANTDNQTNLFNNTSVSAFVTKAVVGQFGADTTEVGVAGEGKKITHAGWVLRVSGTGSVAQLDIVDGGTAYANSDTITVAAPTGGVNAAANVSTNSSGGITSITLTDTGSGFTSVNPTVTITTSTGSTANIVATVGGRAGRTQYETLVAMGSLTGDASDDSILADS